jgi:hypothetical protein
MSKKYDLLQRALSEFRRLTGKASAKKLTAEQRTERACKAGGARQARAAKKAKNGGNR